MSSLYLYLLSSCKITNCSIKKIGNESIPCTFHKSNVYITCHNNFKTFNMSYMCVYIYHFLLQTSFSIHLEKAGKEDSDF